MNNTIANTLYLSSRITGVCLRSMGVLMFYIIMLYISSSMLLAGLTAMGLMLFAGWTS